MANRSAMSAVTVAGLRFALLTLASGLSGVVSGVGCGGVAPLPAETIEQSRRVESGGKKMTMPSIAQRIKQLDFASYSGLEADTSLAELLERFPPLAERPGRGQLGAAELDAQFWSSKTGSARQLRIWFLPNNQVVRIDIEFPTQFDWQQSSTWGAPDAREDYHLGGVLLEQAAWVWARLGITVFSNEERSAVTRVVLYEPCSIEHYRHALYASVPVVERPL